MKRLAITAALLIALAGAAAASAMVAVYDNGFDSKREFVQLKPMAGTKLKACKKDWRKRTTLGVRVLGGKRSCRLGTPVLGDAPLPNHAVKAVVKVTKNPNKGLLRFTYVGVTLRAGPKAGYELRVFPKPRRWELLRGGLVVEQGKSSKINPARKKNRLRISADNKEIGVKVNGVGLTSYRDDNAAEIDGRGTGITYGVRKQAKRKRVASAYFDKVMVLLP